MTRSFRCPTVPHSHGEVAGAACFLGQRGDTSGPYSHSVAQWKFSVKVRCHKEKIFSVEKSLGDWAIESLQLGPLGPAALVLPSLSQAALDGQPRAAVPTRELQIPWASRVFRIAEGLALLGMTSSRRAIGTGGSRALPFFLQKEKARLLSRAFFFLLTLE